MLDPIDMSEHLDQVYEWLLEAPDGEALVQTVQTHFHGG
jgi:hypothetical protein